MTVRQIVLRALPRPIKYRLKKLANYRRRKAIAMHYFNARLRLVRQWVWKDTETSNFYYRLTPMNRDHLAHLVSNVTGQTHEKVTQYFDELETDEELRHHLANGLKGTRYGRDIEVEYGRRLGWYALVRALKPRIVVETGVDHGVGSCVLASALLRNTEEGSPGAYFGTEIRPEAGQLFSGTYASVGKILYGDSIQSLKSFDQPIDIFVNDSDHSGTYEYQEYETIAEKLSDRAVILGDNAHVTDSLSRFSRESGRKFVFFAERPEGHWYPGAGIGISFK